MARLSQQDLIPIPGAVVPKLSISDHALEIGEPSPVAHFFTSRYDANFIFCVSSPDCRDHSDDDLVSRVRSSIGMKKIENSNTLFAYLMYSVGTTCYDRLNKKKRVE